MVFRSSMCKQLFHLVACCVVVARSAPEVVIRELVFRFGIALLYQWLPEMNYSVPIICIERLLCFRQ